MNNIFTIALPYAAALIITLIIIPRWINLCAKYHLFEKPDARKHHLQVIPSMGGVAIFGATVIGFLLFGVCDAAPEVRYVIASATILFFTGFFDDLMNANATKKLLIQFVAAAAVVIAGGLRIESLNGIAGLETLPGIIQYVLPIFLMVFITNAFNFIDGVDGLATTIGLIILSVFGMIFFLKQDWVYATLCFSLIGALTAFLIYNFDPAKIFMGDTGSLVTGFLISVFTVKIIAAFPAAASADVVNSPALLIATMFILIYDLLRVLFIRAIKRTSPFAADRNHLHHMVLRQNFGHRGTTVILAAFNLLFIGLAFFFNHIGGAMFLILCFCIAVILMNTKVITMLAQLRNKTIGEPKRNLEVN